VVDLSSCLIDSWRESVAWERCWRVRFFEPSGGGAGKKEISPAVSWGRGGQSFVRS
jgi:hypothetical protein